MLLAVVPVVFALAGCNRSTNESAPPGTEAVPSATAPAGAPANAQSQIERGKMLVIGGGCHDCHTPKTMTARGPEADMSKMLSGHPESEGVPQPFKGASGPYTIHINDHLTAWSGAWGVSFAANLTPDQNTGLGIWTEDMFITALRTGKHFGVSRPILPPMPWQYFGKMTDDDLKAIFAYLRTIKPISNHVPDPIPPASTTH
jgi:mono/diheme cytochrome c family protein